MSARVRFHIGDDATPGSHRATFGDPGVARGGRGELRDGREAARVKISVAGKGLIPDTTQ